jgi:DNA-binding FrmR family transcriptional regulator
MVKHGVGAIVTRLKRIEGQVRGVIGMVEDDRYCIDILTQIQAVKAALKKVEDEILKNHTPREIPGVGCAPGPRNAVRPRCNK